MWLVPEEPGLADVLAEQGELLSRLRAVVEAKDAENQVLRADLEAARERERRLELRLAELERRLRMDSTDSGTPLACAIRRSCRWFAQGGAAACAVCPEIVADTGGTATYQSTRMTSGSSMAPVSADG